MRILLAAAALALLATPVLADGDIPDGTYQCMADDGIGQGDMVIQGNTYMGPNYDGQYAGRHTFAVGDGGNITFSGPLGLYSAVDVIGGRVVDGPTMQLQVMQDNTILTIDCTPE